MLRQTRPFPKMSRVALEILSLLAQILQRGPDQCRDEDDDGESEARDENKWQVRHLLILHPLRTSRKDNLLLHIRDRGCDPLRCVHRYTFSPCLSGPLQQRELILANREQNPKSPFAPLIQDNFAQ